MSFLQRLTTAFPRLGAVLDTAHQGASVERNDVKAWVPSRMSADAAILKDLPSLVGRAHDLDRNNGVAHGGLQTIVDNVVGTGLRLSARPNWRALGKTQEWAEEFSLATEAKFHEWFWSTRCHAGDTLTGDQLTQQVCRSSLASGEGVALPLWIPERGDGFSTKVQVIDPDRLSQPEGHPNTTQFRGGIEFDSVGMPIAYHVRTTHPGDYIMDGFTFPKWERIPRKTPFGRLRVMHVYDAERPGQSRGKPLLSAVLPQFKNVDRYSQAELQAAVVNALVAMTITTPMEADDIFELWNKDPNAYIAARRDNAVQIGSGMVAPLFPGDKLEGFAPTRPATAFADFVTMVYRLIGVQLDLPLELLLKDFSRTNYSSARAALLEAWRSFNRRRDWLGTTFLDPLYGLWFEEGVNAGWIDVTPAEFYENRFAFLRCRWVGAGRGWIDPAKEAIAAEKRLQIGITTLEDECAEQGKDWREVMSQRAVESAYATELGLPDPFAAPAPPTMPGAPDESEDSGGTRERVA